MSASSKIVSESKIPSTLPKIYFLDHISRPCHDFLYIIRLVCTLLYCAAQTVDTVAFTSSIPQCFTVASRHLHQLTVHYTTVLDLVINRNQSMRKLKFLGSFLLRILTCTTVLGYPPFHGHSTTTPRPTHSTCLIT